MWARVPDLFLTGVHSLKKDKTSVKKSFTLNLSYLYFKITNRLLKRKLFIVFNYVKIESLSDIYNYQKEVVPSGL